MHSFCRDEFVQERPDLITSKEFLAAFPSSPYTSARTVRRNRVLQLGAHVERLAKSAYLMLGNRADLFPTLTEPSLLETRVVRCISRCIRAFFESHPEWMGELRITLLVACTDGFESRASPECRTGDKAGTANGFDGTEECTTVLGTGDSGGNTLTYNSKVGELDCDFELYCHATPLPNRASSKTVVVEIRGRPRENAAAKSSQWVQ
ncbi:unnamed protein product [Choristocarpus tenellus]